MGQWSVNSVVSFAHGRDLTGPATALFASGVNGSDLLEVTEDVLVKDVRLTPFAARKVLAARDAFLAGRWAHRRWCQPGAFVRCVRRAAAPACRSEPVSNSTLFRLGMSAV